MNSLYNITNKFVDLMNKEEELTQEEIREISEELTKELLNKSTNIVGYIKESEMLIDSIKAEEKRLADMRKNGEKKLEKFKQYVMDNMDILRIQEITTSLGTMKMAKNPISIEIENVDDVPSEYKKEIVETKIDKVAIKNYFSETGEIVPGIKVINNKKSLRIK